MIATEVNKKQLRAYQVNSIDQVAKKVAKGVKRIIFQLATGGGKTVTFAGLIQRYIAKNDKKVLVLVHREELLKQARRTLYNWYDIAAAPVTAGVKYLPDVPVYVAMVETASNRLRKNPNYFKNIGLVIVDECHIGNFNKLYDHFKDSIIIGFTATPISSSKKDPLKNHFHDIVCGIDIDGLIDIWKQDNTKGLVPNKTKHIKNVERKDLKVKNGEYDEREMGIVFSNSRHVQNCLAAYLKYAKGKKTLIFNCNVDHSKKVNAAFQEFGLPSRHLDATASHHERIDTVEWFQHTPGAILNNIGILTTGFDEPSIECIIENFSTLSISKWLQTTGRGSRPFPGKDHFIIIDMGGNRLTHGDWSDAHDWEDMFFNPDKPREGGVAPVKVCKQCETVIAAAARTCPECGADNSKAVVYDDGTARFEDLIKTRPISINVSALVDEHSQKMKKDGSPYKDISLLHTIKYRIVIHASRVWKLKAIDDRTAQRLLGIYQAAVREWCEKKDHEFGWWHKKSSQEWFYAELKRVFDYDPPLNSKRA